MLELILFNQVNLIEKDQLYAFDYRQRDGDARRPNPKTWLRDATGGSACLRLSMRPQEQPLRDMDAKLADSVMNDACWIRPPGLNAEVVIADQGAVAHEVEAAAGRLVGLRRDVGLLLAVKPA